MDDLERRTTDMVLNVGRYGTENESLYRDNPLAVEKFALIQTFIAQLLDKGEVRTSSEAMKFSQTARRKMSRRQLKKTLYGLADTAVDIKKNNPDFDNVFVVQGKNLNDALLLETGRSFHGDLTPAVRALFIAYGHDADFHEELEDEINDFESSISDQGEAFRNRVGANADIDVLLVDVLKAINTLEVIMPKLLKNNPGKLAEWLSAVKIEKAPTHNTPTPTT